MDNVRFIREAMERAGSFTALSGRGAMAIGVTALAASWAASRTPTRERWLALWLIEAALAATLGNWSNVGVCFMGLGVIALFAPPAWGDGFMGLGFGGLHLLFGFLIARRHGG